MYMTQGLHRAVQAQPEGLASVYGRRRRTFRELEQRVGRLAAGLQALGVKGGDRIGMLSLNSDWYLEYYLAVYWAGGVVNPVNVRWSSDEIIYSLDDCATSALMLDQNFVHLAEEVLRRSSSVKLLVYAGDGAGPGNMQSIEALIANHKPVQDRCRQGGELAGVFYTGGTTGFPKGVMLSHQGLYSNALTYLAEGIVTHRCKGLHAAPMFHLADAGFMHALLAGGGSHIIVPKFEPTAVLEAIDGEGVTDTLLVPTMIQMLIDCPEIERYRLEQFKGIVYGASPISEALLDRAMAKLPAVAFTQLYGMTELSPIATVLPASEHIGDGRAAGRHRSAGRACVGTEVRIVDSLGKEVPRGCSGEIAVRGIGVMLGYWNKPAETAAVVRDGWMHTGDGGWMSEDGFVYVADRIKDMIVTGGENVYSLEVENAILRCPAVAACAVIGVPDEQWGERVHAFVVLHPGARATRESIIAHCRGLIASYKCPRQIEFTDALPLSGAGKILKSKLREPFWQGYRRNVA